MNVRPLHDRVILQRIEEGEQRSGSIIIPDSAKEKPLEAEVVSVGSGRRTKDGETIPLTLKAGDRVLFGKYTGDEVKLDGVEHIILKEEDVLAVVDRG